MVQIKTRNEPTKTQTLKEEGKTQGAGKGKDLAAKERKRRKKRRQLRIPEATFIRG
jgi:hypothetical protein